MKNVNWQPFIEEEKSKISNENIVHMISIF